MAERISHESLAIMIKSVDDKVDKMVELQTIQNGRTFKNSTDIAKMKGQSGVIAFIVSLAVSIGAIFVGTRR